MKKFAATATALLGLVVGTSERVEAAALSLDGDGDFVEFLGNGVPTGDSPFTIGAWINPTSIPAGGTSGGQITFWGTQGPANTSNGFRLAGESGVRHYFWGNDHDESLPGSVLPDTSNPGHTGLVGGAANNGWHHLAITYDGSETNWYHNGSPLGSPRGVSGVNVADANYRIGSRIDAEFFHGFIDELSIWNVPLSPADIAAGWNQPVDYTNPAVSPALVAYWNFDGGPDDLAGGDNVLTFQGDSVIVSGADAFVPEPSTTLLGLLGVLVLFRRRR